MDDSVENTVWPIRIISNGLPADERARDVPKFHQRRLVAVPGQLRNRYLDDHLIYSNNLQVHQEHFEKIPAALTKQGLHLKPDQ